MFAKMGQAGEKREGAFALRVRVADRLFGSAAALLLQAGFLLLLFQSVHRLTPQSKTAHELTFILPRLAPQPTKFGALRPARTPAIVISRPAAPSLPAPPTAVPQAGLQGFGQSLFGCTPDAYLSMTPEQRSHCPKPGERVQRSDEDELLNPKTHSKDAALWQEGIDERDWAPTECQGNMAFVIECQTQAMHDERMRRDKVTGEIAAAHARTRPPSPKLPDVGVRRGP
jgi:hypothetical protein